MNSERPSRGGGGAGGAGADGGRALARARRPGERRRGRARGGPDRRKTEGRKALLPAHDVLERTLRETLDSSAEEGNTYKRAREKGRGSFNFQPERFVSGRESGVSGIRKSGRGVALRGGAAGGEEGAARGPLHLTPAFRPLLIYSEHLGVFFRGAPEQSESKFQVHSSAKNNWSFDGGRQGKQTKWI